MMEHNEMKSRICDLVNITDNKFQLIHILSRSLEILKKDLTGVVVSYHSGGGYSSNYVKVVSPFNMVDFKLPSEFYVKNSDGEKFKITRGITTFGGGHGEGSPVAGTTMNIDGVGGYNWNYRDRELTIITKEDALS